jgi:hypothetical protein
MPAPSAPASAAPHTQRTAWLLFFPPALLAGLRWWLQWQTERGPQAMALALEPLAAEAGLAAALLPGAGVVGALLVLSLVGWFATRRGGGRRVRQGLLVAWVLLWLAGSGELLSRHLNLQGRVALAPVQAQVLGSRPRAPSLHSTGGTELVLRVEGLGGAQQVLTDDPQAAQWRPGQRLTLQWARGRSSGRFVTGWQEVAAARPDL